MIWSQPMPSLRVGDGPHRLGREAEGMRPRVEHDEVVAEPVHLAEMDRLSLHGRLAFAAI